MNNEQASLLGGPQSNVKGLLSLVALLGVSFLMALDFMIVFLTVQGYWVYEGGSYEWYGVVFSSYTIAQCVFIPLVAELLDRKYLRSTLFVTVLVNLIGNVVYMSGGSTSSSHLAQALIIIGRIIAGAGAANVVAGPYWIVSNTENVADRASRIAHFNLAGFAGRVVGPVLAFTILGFEPTTTIGGKFVLNAFTWPPLITTIIGIPVLFTVFLVSSQAVQYDSRDFKGDSKVKTDFTIFLVVHTLIILVFWAWYANIITVAGVQFGFAQAYGSNLFWRAYLPVLVGFVFSTRMMKFLEEGSNASPLKQLLVSPIFMLLGFLLLIDYNQHGIYTVAGEVRFWLGSIALATGFNWENANVYAIFSEMIDSTGNFALMGRLLGILTLFTCIGRAIGPLWTPPILKAQESDPSCCTFISFNSFENNTCCSLSGVNTVGILLILATVGIILFMFLKLRTLIERYKVTTLNVNY